MYTEIETTSTPAAASNKASKHRRFLMTFNVIVTFKPSSRVLEAIDHSVAHSDAVGLFQVTFDHGISITAASSYDSVMRRIKSASLAEVATHYNLSDENIANISTNADWCLWQQITSQDMFAAAQNSAVSKNGKFFF